MPDNNKNKSSNQGQHEDQGREPSPNDQRSTVKNPNNPAFDADQNNRQQQRQGQDQSGFPRAPSASVPQPDAAPDKHK